MRTKAAAGGGYLLYARMASSAGWGKAGQGAGSISLLRSMKVAGLIAVPVAIGLLFGHRCAAGGSSAWVHDLKTHLKCGMTLVELQSRAGNDLNTLGARGRLGTHFIRRGATDLWFDFDDQGLKSYLVSEVSGFETVRLSPRQNVCTGALSFLVRVSLPAGFEDAKVYLDDVLASKPGRLLVDGEVSAGEHDIRIESGARRIVRHLTLRPEDRGDVEVRILPTDG